MVMAGLLLPPNELKLISFNNRQDSHFAYAISSGSLRPHCCSLMELFGYQLALQQALLTQQQRWQSIPKPLLAWVTWQLVSDLGMAEDIKSSPPLNFTKCVRTSGREWLDESLRISGFSFSLNGECNNTPTESTVEYLL